MKNMDANCIVDAKSICGEGPVWDHRSGLLWWVDIAGEQFHCFDPTAGTTAKFEAPCLVSGLCLAPSGLLVASAQGIALFDPDSMKFSPMHNPEPEQGGNRLNDMAVDKDGGLWAGTMSEGAKGSTGALHRYNVSGSHKVVKGLTISNGIDWSADGRTFYLVDSWPRIIWKYDVNDAGNIVDACVLRTFDENDGRPDGLCVDGVGTIWTAMCGGGFVLGLSPEGKTITRIHVDAPQVTSCAFGGNDLKTLYITTGTFGLDKEQLAVAPMSGGLFAIQMHDPGRKQVEALWPAV